MAARSRPPHNSGPGGSRATGRHTRKLAGVMPQPASSSDLLLTVPTTDRQRADLSAALGHPKRLAAVELLALLEAPAEQSFDRLTRLAAKVLRAPVAFLSLVDGGRSVFKSSVGLPEPWVSRREIPLSHSVCRYVVAANAPLVIDDARSHPLAVDNQAVAELRIVAYLGTPLVTSDGYPLGTLAVIDTVPRAWTPEDVSVLGDLAASAMTEIELRAETDQRQRVEQHLGLLETAVGNATDAVLVAEADPSDPSETRVVFVNEAYTGRRASRRARSSEPPTGDRKGRRPIAPRPTPSAQPWRTARRPVWSFSPAGRTGRSFGPS